MSCRPVVAAAGAAGDTRYIPPSDAIALIEIDKMCLFLCDPGNVLLLQRLLCHFVVCYNDERRVTQVPIPFSLQQRKDTLKTDILEHRHVPVVGSCNTYRYMYLNIILWCLGDCWSYTCVLPSSVPAYNIVRSVCISG